MKKIKITDARGKVHELGAYWGDVLQAAHDAAEHNDQIETAKLTVEIDGEVVELILPKDVVVNLLAGLGAGSGEAAAEEEAAAAAATEGGDAGEEEQAAAAAAEEEEDAAAQAARRPVPGRLDADWEKTLRKVVDAAVKKAVATEVDKKVAAKMGEIARSDAERAEIERIAAPLLSEGYKFADSDPWKVCADALKVDDKDDPEAVALAARARKNDARAQGELIANLKHAAKAKRDGLDSSDDLIESIGAKRDEASGDKGVSRVDAMRAKQAQRFRRQPAKKTDAA